MGCGSGVGVRLGSGVARVSVETSAIAVGSSGIGDSSQRQKRVSSFASQTVALAHHRLGIHAARGHADADRRQQAGRVEVDEIGGLRRLAVGVDLLDQRLQAVARGPAA